MKRVRLPLLALVLGVGHLLPFHQANASPVAVSVRVVGPAQPDSATLDSLPYLTRVYTHPVVPNDSTPTIFIMVGTFPYPCGAVYAAQVIDPHHVAFGIENRPPCSDSARTWFEGFQLGVLPAGPHRVEVEFTVRHEVGPVVYKGAFEFLVTGRDTTPPPPPPGPLPYVQSIRIRPQSNFVPIERPICPQDSIVAQIFGLFPNDCFELRDVQLRRPIPPVTGPPIVRLVVDDRACLGRPCIAGQFPWATAVLLPPLPVGDYQLQVELGQVTCSDSIPPDSLYTELFPFAVIDSCPPPPTFDCLIGAFEHPNGVGGCDAFVSPARPSTLTFGVNSPRALSGVQGELRINPDVLRVALLEPIGPAAGMHLTWARTPTGARFVLFAASGAPIPAAPWPNNAAVPILRVTVAMPQPVTPVGMPPGGGPGIPQNTQITPLNLLGSDIEGGGVTQCYLRDPRIADIFSGRICVERVCDSNADGLVDVRDLVLLVHCLNGEGPCTDSTGAVFDCNRDSTFTLEDVICCAGRALRQGICPHCPPDSTRPEPRVRLNLGSPIRTATGVDVPLRLEGADRIGAAQFVLRYPLDRYEVSSVEFPDLAADWLDLYQVRDGEVAIGLIQTASQAELASSSVQAVEMLVHLKLKPGSEPGGELQATQGDFSGPDGVKLGVDMGKPSQALGGPARFALSASRPNPFSGETRFTLTLDRSADVRVGIYDIGGRLVAPLHRGALEAGEREFVWNGTHADGTPAANGIYFYRAVSNGVTVAHKVILVRGN